MSRPTNKQPTSSNSSKKNPAKHHFEDAPDYLAFMIANQYSQLALFLSGALLETHVPVLDDCMDKLQRLRFDSLVVDLFGIRAVDAGGARAFEAFSKTILGRGALLKLCAIRPEVHAVIVDSGIILNCGIDSDVSSAIRSLSFRRSSDPNLVDIAKRPAGAVEEDEKDDKAA